MDDLLIIDNDYNRLLNGCKKIVERINNLDLEINEKTQIFDIKRGFSFLGYTYKIKNNKLIINVNNQTMRRIRKHLKRVNYNRNSLISYKGFFQRTTNYNKIKNEYNYKS